MKYIPENAGAPTNGNDRGAASGQTNCNLDHIISKKSDIVKPPCLDAALAALALGLHPIPVGPDKKPLIKWTEFQKRRPTPEEVVRWFEKFPSANVAIITGTSEGVDVIDFDPGHEQWPPDEKKFWLPTFCVVQTPRDGRHNYIPHIEGVRNSASKLAKGVDVRGEGGYVLIPPSTVNGKAYQYLTGSHAAVLKATLEAVPCTLIAALKDASRDGDGEHKKKQKGPGKAIPERERNDTLTRMAGAMRRKGMSREAIEAALLKENERRCVPPLSCDEVAAIALSVSRYEPSGDSPRFNQTDTGNAQFFASLFGERVRYDHRRGRWLIWGGHWLQENLDGAVIRFGQETAKARYLEGWKIKDREKAQDEASFALKSENRQRIEAMLALARNMNPITDAGDKWDSDNWLLGVSNGVVDLRTGTLRDGKPEDKITLHIDIPFDIEAPCPRWRKFLDEIFKGDIELIEYIYRSLGYSLTGDISEQCFWLMYGRGANGKSVFLRTIGRVLGPYAYNAPFSTFELMSRPGISNDLAALDGRRLVTSSETNEGTRLNEARIKALTGGEPITARFLYHEDFTFTPRCKVWLAVNHKPLVEDDSLGLWRRVRLIPFLQKFEGEADDKGLFEKLIAEAPGILAWMIRGCLDYQKNGLITPQSVLSATKEYQIESDPLGGFIAERCNIKPECRGIAGVLYSAFREWAENEGMRDEDIMKIQEFGRRMIEKFEKTKINGKRGYKGIGLKEGE